MNSSKTIIKVQNLSSSYGKELVIDDISFDIDRGEIFVILGGSGSGKSTILKHMIGLHKPLSGKILIEGQDIVTADGTDKLLLLRKFGVTYQGGALFGSMTVTENLRLALEEFTKLPAELMDLICQIKLKLVALDGFGDFMPSELSGGMQKRAAIARALVLNPKIIFLDEPSAGLDPVTSAELDKLIFKLSRTLQITFVIVTHELDSIFRIADRMILLDKKTKKIAASGKPRTLQKSSVDPWVKQFLNRDFDMQK